MMEPIRIDGLKEFQKALRAAGAEAPKQLRLAFNEAADLVSGRARGQVPRRSGAAAGTVRSKSTRTAARVSGGSRRVPYYAWLDFGGKVGPGGRVRRPFLKHGRYIYDAYYAERPRFAELIVNGVRRLAATVGWDVR
jgi:hypothetical protein